MSDTHTALLVMDIQTSITSRFIQSEETLTPVHTALAAARQAGLPVIYVVVGFRPGFPEVSMNNKMFGARRQPGSQPIPHIEPEIHPTLAPKPGEHIVTKRRVSAFTGSDLEVLLRAQHITHLVLCGIATSGVVLSTLREAADRDYQLTVLSDCCFDGDEEVQRVLLTKIFPRQADVVTVAEWQAQLQKQG